MNMDLQADIKWIISELRSVKDPHLVEAFKQLLAYRKTKKELEASKGDELETALIRAMADAAEGRVKSHNEIRKKYEKWL